MEYYNHDNTSKKSTKIACLLTDIALTYYCVDCDTKLCIALF